MRMFIPGFYIIGRQNTNVGEFYIDKSDAILPGYEYFREYTREVKIVTPLSKPRKRESTDFGSVVSVI